MRDKTKTVIDHIRSFWMMWWAIRDYGGTVPDDGVRHSG